MTVSGVNAAFFEKTGAAGNDGRVSARTMSVVRRGDRFYFQIDGGGAAARKPPRGAVPGQSAN